jgi:hypothetical protein
MMQIMHGLEDALAELEYFQWVVGRIFAEVAEEAACLLETNG